MALQTGSIKQLAEALDKRLHGNHLAHFVQYCDDVFYFHVSKGTRLYLIADNQDPRVYLSQSKTEVVSFASSFSSFVRRDLGNAEVIKVTPYNEDRIIRFELTIINDVFKIETRYLYCELIPGRANLVVCDGDNKVLSAFRASMSEHGRILIKGALYEAPEKKEGFKKEGEHPFDFPSYLQECEAKEESLKQRRKRTRFKGLLHFLASKRKSSERKIAKIDDDIRQAEKRKADGAYGDYIYTNYDEIDTSLGYMMVDGEKIALDPLKNKAQNAEAFYRRAKKARQTVASGHIYLDEALKERAFYEQLSDVVNLSEEEDLEAMASKYGLDELTKKGRNGKSALGEEAILPFHVVRDGTSYVFGRNANQNDFLSFLYDHSKNHIWMHLKDEHGSHLIIRKENPSDKEKQFGAELCCLASKKEGGEIMVALKKDVRRGHKNGEAIVKEYQTVLIRKVSKEAKEAFAGAKKIKLR